MSVTPSSCLYLQSQLLGHLPYESLLSASLNCWFHISVLPLPWLVGSGNLDDADADFIAKSNVSLRPFKIFALALADTANAKFELLPETTATFWLAPHPTYDCAERTLIANAGETFLFSI